MSMPDWVEQVLRWGLDVVISVQDVARASGLEEVLDPLFRSISALGDVLFFLTFLPILFWCIDKRCAARLALLFLTSVYVNIYIKEWCAIPRPFILSDKVLAKVDVSGYSFPSGHAQITAAVWPALAILFRRPWVTAIAVPLLILIPFSRIYLGVHDPQDAVAGAAIGLALMLLHMVAGPRIERRLTRTRVASGTIFFVVLTTIMATLMPTSEGLALSGGLFGLSIGYIVEIALFDFRPDHRWHTYGLRLAVGLLLCLAAYLAILGTSLPAIPLDDDSPWCFARYALMGFVPTLIVPWAFIRLRLATSRFPAPKDR